MTNVQTALVILDRILRGGIENLLHNDARVRYRVLSFEDFSVFWPHRDEVEVVLMEVSHWRFRDLENRLIQLQTEAPAVRVIVVSSRLTPYDIHRMMRLGVKGFIHREDLAESLLTSLDLVRRQVVTLSPRASNLFASQSYLNPLEHLTPLDKQVLRMMAHDFNVKTIASALEVSLRSVYRARERLREILGVNTNEGLVNTARELGLLADDDD